MVAGLYIQPPVQSKVCTGDPAVTQSLAIPRDQPTLKGKSQLVTAASLQPPLSKSGEEPTVLSVGNRRPTTNVDR